MTRQKMYVTEFDCAAGVQSEREFTEEEYANHEKMMAEQAELIKQREAEEQIIAETKASAISKLIALGLSEEEIKALTGN